MTQEQLTEEKTKLEQEIKNCEAKIEAERRNIHWYKKRKKLIEQQIKSLDGTKLP